MLSVFGVIFLLFLTLFVPRAVTAICIGIIIGGGWWWLLFIPLAIVGLAIDAI